MQGRTAWRIEGTLREFPKFPPVNLWFDYPVHHVDNIGVLADVEPDGEVPAWKKAQEKRKPPGEKKAERKAAIETAYSACTIDGDVTVEALAEYMGTSEKTVRRKLKEHDSFVIENGVVKQRDKGQN